MVTVVGAVLLDEIVLCRKFDVPYGVLHVCGGTVVVEIWCGNGVCGENCRCGLAWYRYSVVPFVWAVLCSVGVWW